MLFSLSLSFRQKPTNFILPLLLDEAYIRGASCCSLLPALCYEEAVLHLLVMGSRPYAKGAMVFVLHA